MKKKLIGIICLSLLFVMTGCNKETNQDNTVIQDNTNDNKEAIVDDVSVNDETNDIINNNQSESVENESDNINNDNRKSEENIIDNTTNNNEDYNDSEQVIETPIESKKEDTPSCIEKKFSNTYSYVYSTKEECKLNGSSVFDDVYENKDDTIFSYGCDTIIDDCGNTWYGIYFLRYSENGNIKLYY